MKKIFLKYKYNLLYIIVVSFFLFYFIPSQEKYYFRDDTKIVENHFWKMIIILTTVIITAILFISKIKYQLKIKDILLLGFNLIVLSFFFSFIFRSIIISLILFDNRFINQSSITKIYKVEYYKELEFTRIIELKDKDTITFLFSSENQTNINRMRKDKGVKEINKSDTIHLKINKGIFGINYIGK